MARKVERSKTQTDHERIQALEDGLDAAIKENRRLRADFDALANDPLRAYRPTFRRKFAPLPHNAQQLRDDPDETVN